jgi:hypothetical protein
MGAPAQAGNREGLPLLFEKIRIKDRGCLMKLINRWITALVVILSLLLSACGASSGPTGKVSPSQLEPIEGTDFSRVVLTEKAAERLDIQTVPVREEQIVRKLTVAGQFVAANDSSGTNPAAADASAATTGIKMARVMRVPLSETELREVDRSQPARVLPLDDAEDSDETAGLMAEPDESLASDDPEDAALYYVLDSMEQGLAPGQPVLAELSLSGGDTPRKVVPQAAVLYGVHGETWVYTNPEPLVFVRQPIVIDYIEENLAFLSEGPEAGTEVVTVGAAELFGAETGVSK